MKRKIHGLLLSILLILALTSCSELGTKTAKLQDSISVPEDGIIEASVFERLKEENGIIVFRGESNRLRYEWTVFGSDIDKPKSLNLGVELTATEDSVLIRYLSSEGFGFSPVLTIYLGSGFNAERATVYDRTDGSKASLCSASITGTDGNIINFSSVKQTGICEIIPDRAGNNESSVSGGSEVQDEQSSDKTVSNDPYLSESSKDDNRVISDGKDTEQDKYKTDPVPEGKPKPVEPEDQTVDKRKTYTCIFSIECSTILNNIGDLEPEKLDVLPSSGIIFPEQTVTFYDGESVFDVLQRICKENNIHMEASWTPMYNSAYIEGIHNLYEFDCGSGSGWMYRVDGWYPNYGCSRYQLKQGEKVEWRYTCDLGKDVGGGYAVGE